MSNKHPPRQKEGCLFMFSKHKKIILFANGELPEPENLIPQINPEDVLIAVDGGLDHITSLGFKPNLIIGDLDSINLEALEEFRSQGVVIHQYPREKDQTDLEIALGFALERKAKTIWVVAALGNRLDQTLANIFLLTKPQLAKIDIRLVDGLREVFLIRSTKEIHGHPGQRVSLLPLNGMAEGVRTEGLKYPLNNETLYPEQTRGVSNEMISTSAGVSLQQGLLLCIHEFSPPTERS